MSGYRRAQKLASTTDAVEREETVRELGERKTGIALEELIVALDDVAWPVRASAARALGEIGDSRAIVALAAKLADPAAGIGEEAAHALGFLGDWAATPFLMEAAKTPDATVRIAALRALGRLADPQAAPTLIAALNALWPTRCEAACAALAAIGSSLRLEDASEAQTRLLALLTPDVDRGMRLAAARTIEHLAPLLAGAQEPLYVLAQDEREPAVLARLAVALAQLALTHDPAPSARFSALLHLAWRLEGTGLAHLQALNAAAETVLAPGTFYPLLSLKGMARDEAVSKLSAEPALLEAFSQGHYADTIAQCRALAPLPALESLAQNNDPSAEEALLALCLVRQH